MTVQCELCPKACLIEPGQSGECRVRVNLDGKLVAVTYGYACSVHVDPVEKKPLFHFLPGTGILSIATAGCNLHCQNCQNWQISQRNPEDVSAEAFPPELAAEAAKRYRCLSVAYTYTDPIVFYEYTLDSCIKAREAGLKNVLVTAGYINETPLRKLCQYVDAANIDLKAFSDAFYRDICSGTLAPVLNTLAVAKSLGVMVEVTNLVIPTLNDSDDDLQKLCRWVATNLGNETPLHFSRFHPDFRMKNLPPTPGRTLDRAKEIAKSEGLYYVYIGNIIRQDAGNTYCHVCGRLLIERQGYVILQNVLENGKCPDCKTEVYGTWI
ncbi:MAG TPA: AmmeMemoRadiSam system radical SAM enzyme [Candidatus Hydrogenedentes bacterium]|nr:AmmeMemoRadiSam system radical SAM enzyme [Candidatus Hydrogenedentota bacterium]HIJ74616.1 AmmeMemoRadiSam system radical SAM enzyme [Candidatus Hydrogenedentota bacterium]